MLSIPQNIFRPPQDALPSEIPYYHYPSRNTGSAIDHLTTLQDSVGNRDQTIVFGVSHRLSSKGELEYLCISTNNHAAIISFTDTLPPTSTQDSSLAQLLDVKKYTLVGFNMSRTALYLNARTHLHVRGIDLTAVYRDPKEDSALSAATIVQKQISDGADTWKVLRLWNHERGQRERDLCLQAWLAYCVASRARGLKTMVRVDTAHLNRSELELLTRMVKEVDILDGNQPAETAGDFSSATVDDLGHIKLLNSRYKTRIRTSEHAKIILTDSSGKNHWGKASSAKGKTTTIALQNRPVTDLEFDKVRVYGRSAALNHEKARDTLVMHLLTGVKSLRDAPFICALWFPKCNPTFFIRGRGGVSAAQAEIILRDVRLNDSQKRAALSLVSQDPLVVVHGPPGTGKTTTISASAKVWHAHRRPTWIVAQSNVAVKNIAASLYKHKVDFKLIVSKDFHFEWHEHLYEELSERIIRSDEFAHDPRHTARAFHGVHIVLCTLSMLSNPVLRQRGVLDIVPLERLVIDEASQINAFEYLNIFDKYSKTLEKVCFFGDPHQLPPFGKTDAPTIKTIFDFKKVTICDYFLDTQYRMPIPIGRFISSAVYDRRLKSEHPITSSDCVKFIDMQGCEEKAGFSWRNSREANLMVHLVKNYYSTKEFCIITPYDAQRAMIHAALEKDRLRSDTVFNLDSFQGS
ncbi:P-loop containing nucleoside triphosphate hydrolase protein [Panaeolus papilionaceus]|nr:P-loop containing nucleoside triphosphate hydrolase protein [Panaeolus papilionaceus]